MLGPVGLSEYNFYYDNWGTNPSGTPGTSVTPGASSAEGAWTQVASSANIQYDCYWMYIKVSGGATSAAAKNHLLDIGVDPAGGTTYTALINNLVCGQSPTLTAITSREYLFPIFIKAGSSVAVRIQGSNATAGTVRVSCRWWGAPARPEAVPVGTIFQTIGSTTGSSGQSFTPGNAADGSWTDLGAVAPSTLWWWQVGVQVDNATVTAEYCYVEIAYGNSTNKHIISKVMIGGGTTETHGFHMNTQMLACSAFRRVPAGSNIYIRGRADSAPDTGYNATVIGVGG